jgi:hypothetical protein
MACTQQMVVNRHINGNFDVKYGKIWDHTLQSILGEQHQLLMVGLQDEAPVYRGLP